MCWYKIRDFFCRLRHWASNNCEAEASVWLRVIESYNQTSKIYISQNQQSLQGIQNRTHKHLRTFRRYEIERSKIHSCAQAAGLWSADALATVLTALNISVRIWLSAQSELVTTAMTRKKEKGRENDNHNFVMIKRIIVNDVYRWRIDLRVEGRNFVLANESFIIQFSDRDCVRKNPDKSHCLTKKRHTRKNESTRVLIRI